LDPFATGLLVVLAGAATRLARYLACLPKRYAGVIRLGVVTDTDDPTGNVLARTDAWREISDPVLAQAMAALAGRRHQAPPVFSAKHVAGERAHRRARRGESVRLHPVPVEISRFDLVRRQGSEVQFTADVSSGTYVRSLARELGERLGCGAHLASLRRTAVGPFSVDEAVPLARHADGLGRALRPPRDAVRHLTAVTIDDASRAHVRDGRPVRVAAPDGPTALLAADGRLVAVADVERGEARPRVVLPS
jgi:tRNA pseudouridine55 synthase